MKTEEESMRPSLILSVALLGIAACASPPREIKKSEAFARFEILFDS